MMGGVEMSLKVTVQDSLARYPPFEQRRQNLSPAAGTLTSACEYLIPRTVEAVV
jgi:hypothetical protein